MPAPISTNPNKPPRHIPHPEMSQIVGVYDVILDWFKRLYESSGCKETPFDLEKLVRDLEPKLGPRLGADIMLILKELRRQGRLLFYYDKKSKQYILVKVIED